MLRYLWMALLLTQFGCDLVEDQDPTSEAGASGTDGTASDAGTGGTAGEAGSGGTAGEAGSGGTPGEAESGALRVRLGQGALRVRLGRGELRRRWICWYDWHPMRSSRRHLSKGQTCEPNERRIRTACGEANQACCIAEETCDDADQDQVCDGRDPYCNVDGSAPTCRRLPQNVRQTACPR